MTVTKETLDTDARIIGLRLTAPSEPSIDVRTTPTLNLVEFLTYAMSCVSTWTGLSIMSVEPVSLMRAVGRNFRRCHHKKEKDDGKNDDDDDDGKQEAGRSRESEHSSRSHEEERSEMRKHLLGKICMMHHVASLSRRITRLEQHFALNRY